MATRRYKLSPGMTEFQIEEEVGAANASHVIELTVDLANLINDAGSTRKIKKSELILALEMLQNHVLKNFSGMLEE